MLSNLKKELRSHITPGKKPLLERFFKTGKGQYAEGDVFLGVMVPEQRKVAKQFKDLSLSDVEKLLYSEFHEERLVGLFILTSQYQKTDDKKKLCDFYLKHRKQVNNWDLVDLTAHKILGDYLLDKDRDILYKYAKSNHLWTKRISVIATFAFIDKGQFEDSLNIAELLLSDKHDLIHKAVGWMLREIGKKDQAVLEKFLKKHCRSMPRTMLRYSIEKFDEKKRKFYMNK